MKRNSINMSGDYYVDIDIDYDEALEAIPEEYIREWLGSGVASDFDPLNAALEDPAKRLEVITWLRSNGWSVEPA